MKKKFPVICGIITTIILTFLMFYTIQYSPVTGKAMCWVDMKTVGAKLHFILWIPALLFSSAVRLLIELTHLTGWKDVLIYNFGTVAAIFIIVFQIFCYYLFSYYIAKKIVR